MTDSDVSVNAELVQVPAASIGDTMYNTLEEALNSAVSGQTVLLINDYAMNSNATVKAGVFLLLPCMDNDIGYTSTGFNPDGTSSSTADLSVLYRTLKIPSTVKLTVEGTILINAVTGRPAAGNYDMDITGGYSQILLNGNIIVKNGGILDNCGYIKGSGEVTAESGAEIRDLFVIRNWRGGSQALAIMGGRMNVLLNRFSDPFMFNEYDCHNIQAVLKINSGASFVGNVKTYAGNVFGYSKYLQIHNTDGFIRLNDGAYLIRSYDMLKGTEISIFGGATFDNSIFDSHLGGINKKIPTSKFTYPIDGDISFNLHNGNYVFNNDFKFLTGSAVTVHGDASLTVPIDKKVVFYDYFEDVPNVDGTEYPQRSAAVLTLKGNSTLDIQGQFAGIVECETDNQIIIGETAVTSGVESNEANGYLNSTDPIVTLIFNLDVRTTEAGGGGL